MMAASHRQRLYEDRGYVQVPDVLPADEVDTLCAEMAAVEDVVRARRGSLEASWPGAYREQLGTATSIPTRSAATAFTTCSATRHAWHA